MTQGSSSEEPLKNSVSALSRETALELPSDAHKKLEDALRSTGTRPQELKAVIQTVVQTFEMATFHSGPLPRAKDFADYDAVCPGAAQTILNMAVKAQDHSIESDKATLRYEFILQMTGMISAIGIMVAMIAAALFAAFNGYPWVAVAIMGSTGLAAVAGLFLRNSRAKPEPILRPDGIKSAQGGKQKRPKR